MNAQEKENKNFIRKYLEALTGKPKTPELVDQYVAKKPRKDHIAMNEAAFPGYEILDGRGRSGIGYWTGKWHA